MEAADGLEIQMDLAFVLPLIPADSGGQEVAGNIGHNRKEMTDEISQYLVEGLRTRYGQERRR